MAIQARWPALDVPNDVDPFQLRVEEVGKPITLKAEYADLNTRLIALVQREAELHTAGVRCAVKDREDTACMACPIAAHDDPSAPLQPLCACGREQELVLTEMAVAVEANAG